MKSIIVAVVALLASVSRVMAADMPVPQAAPVPPPVYFPAYYNWSGIYLGVNGGYGFGQSNWTNGSVSTGSFNTNGFLVGGTLGANYQTGSYLVGFEGDIDWSNVQGSTSTATCATLGAPGATCQTKNTWLGTARARVGYAFDRLLVFGSGGAAFGGLTPALNPGWSSIQPYAAAWLDGGRRRRICLY
jgi:outer membrane immunogenic protein